MFVLNHNPLFGILATVIASPKPPGLLPCLETLPAPFVLDSATQTHTEGGFRSACMATAVQRRVRWHWHATCCFWNALSAKYSRPGNSFGPRACFLEIGSRVKLCTKPLSSDLEGVPNNNHTHTHVAIQGVNTTRAAWVDRHQCHVQLHGAQHTGRGASRRDGELASDSRTKVHVHTLVPCARRSWG